MNKTKIPSDEQVDGGRRRSCASHVGAIKKTFPARERNDSFVGKEMRKDWRKRNESRNDCDEINGGTC